MCNLFVLDTESVVEVTCSAVVSRPRLLVQNPFCMTLINWLFSGVQLVSVNMVLGYKMRQSIIFYRIFIERNCIN